MQEAKKRIKVALVNTSDLNGGAAIACYRLTEALQKEDEVDALMFVKQKRSDVEFVRLASSGKRGEYIGKVNHMLEKGTFLVHESSKENRFLFSNPNFGQDISNIEEIKDADVIHLHWINKGFLSYKSLDKLVKLNKPIVWTLHDMWGFTGGCHYAADCTNFRYSCGNCFLLKNPKENDLSRRIWNKKINIYSIAKMQMVTCSAWLKDIAASSSLLKKIKVQNIPNTIDLDLFKPKEKGTRPKSTILFQAMNINDKRKGLNYFLEAMKIIETEHPDFADNIELLIFGKNSKSQIDDLSVDVKYLGLLKSQQEVIDTYNKSDVFVIPSLEDNLPNTIMEAMACGVPVVGFETGGIPEMITHKKTGFIAEQKNSRQLAKGIIWTLENEERRKELGLNSRNKAISEYSHNVIAKKHIQVYKSALGLK